MPDSAVPISTQLRQRLADLVAVATDGEVGSADVLGGQFTLRDLGVSSVAHMRVIDAVDREFGVELDPGRMDTLDDLVAQVEAGS